MLLFSFFFLFFWPLSNLLHCAHPGCLKGWPAYKFGKFETNSLQSMTQSHRCWFITNIWKSDHHLNMTFGTDMKFTLSFLSAKSLCWWKWTLSYFKTQKLWSEDSLNTNGQGLSGDVDSAVLSVSHTLVTSAFQVQPLLSNSSWTVSFCSWFMPLKAPSLCPNWDWHKCTCANFHSPKIYLQEPSL